MKKFVIHYNYYATADVTVLADSKEEAIEKADQIESLMMNLTLNMTTERLLN